MADTNLTDIGLPTKVAETKYADSFNELSFDDRRRIYLYYNYLWKECALRFLEAHIEQIRENLAQCIQKKWDGIQNKRVATNIWWGTSDNDSECIKITQDFRVFDTQFINQLDSVHAKFQKEQGIMESDIDHSVFSKASHLDLIVFSNHRWERDNIYRICCWGLNDEDTLTEFHINGGTPLTGINFIVPNFLENIFQEVQKKTKTTSSPKKKESLLESELYDWLILNSIPAFRQAKKTTGNVNDIWIPDTMFLELKRGSVTGNDVCQAIEYYSESKIPVVLVGDKITTKASKGLKGFNAIREESIVFVDWTCVKDYLKGRLSIK